MADLKAHPPRDLGLDTSITAARGRDNYDLRGVLRTKPGRADSEATLSMSCSDKIASWTLTGLQGSLLFLIMQPVYINCILVGEVESHLEDAMKAECERAFVSRLQNRFSRSIELPFSVRSCKYILKSPRLLSLRNRHLLDLRLCPSGTRGHRPPIGVQ